MTTQTPKLVLKDGKAQLFTPFNSNLPAAAKARGGRWDADARCWSWQEAQAEQAAAACEQAFGFKPSLADRPAKPAVSVRLTAVDTNVSKLAAMTFGHVTLAYANPAKSGAYARPASGVAVVAGELLTGGHNKPVVVVRPGTALELKLEANFAESVLGKEVSGWKVEAA